MRIHAERCLITLICIATVSVVSASTSFEYDNLHRLTRVTYDDGSAVLYEYDAAGNRTLRVINGSPGTVHLHVAVEPPDSGVVTKDPDQEWYPLGTPVTLTAEPAGFEPLCAFDQWTGDVPTGHESDNPLSLTMDGYKSVTAHFATSLGDADWDCDLDLPDFAGFQECFGLDPLPPGCEVFDLDSSGLVDWADVELWIDAMSGPSE